MTVDFDTVRAFACMRACVRVCVWVPGSRCQCCDFTFYCIVNAGILFVYYIYITITVCILCTCLVLWDFVCFSS